ERCGGGSGANERAVVELGVDGVVTIYVGSMSNGQGHETAYAQLVSDRLGIAADQIRVVQGDTDLVLTGSGTGASWSIPTGGNAVWLATGKLIENALEAASHMLETAVSDLEYADGRISVVGTDRMALLSEVVASRRQPIAGEFRYVPE